MKVLVPLAEGFEETEAVSIIDVLRRAGINAVTAHTAGNPVTGSHGIPVTADRPFAGLMPVDFDGIALPGGMPGSENLRNDPAIISFVRELHRRGALVSAICAAPIVLARAGVLAGKRVTCYPGFEDELDGAHVTGEPVVADSMIVTGRGAGCAIPFAIAIAGILMGEKMRDELKDRLQVYWEL